MFGELQLYFSLVGKRQGQGMAIWRLHPVHVRPHQSDKKWNWAKIYSGDSWNRS